MLKWNKIVFVLMLFLVSNLALFAQDKNQLKKNKNKIHKELKTIKGLLSENKDDQDGAEVRHLLSKLQITAREELIQSINEEIGELDHDLDAQNYSIDSLKNQLVEFQEQYRKMLLYAYKNRNATNSIIFVFSSDNFNQAYKRLKYLKKIGEYREYQATEIVGLQKTIEDRIIRLEKKKEKKKRILGDRYYEKNKLQKEKKANKELLQELKKDEKKLKKKIRKKQKEEAEVDLQITKIIEREIAAAQKRADKERERLRKLAKKNGTKQPNFGDAPIAPKLSMQFAQNKGKFPWPVKTGKISARFGVRPHPVFEGLKVTNNGINMMTNKGTNATAIFTGNVAAVIVLPSGGKSAVLLQHGAYFTMYSNLITVKVKKGQKVKLGQNLGLIKTEDNGKTEIHFELWKGNAKQNPEGWLKKK
jgi:septal ring factor EnvC (AmiA/AmiB activator)